MFLLLLLSYMLVHDILDEITKKFDVVSSQREHVQEEIKKSGAQCRKVGADLSLALSGAERFHPDLSSLFLCITYFFSWLRNLCEGSNRRL